MVNELHINQKIMRKGSLREIYSIKEKKVVNNIFGTYVPIDTFL